MAISEELDELLMATIALLLASVSEENPDSRMR